MTIQSAALIVVYRRSENLRTILQLCSSQGVKSIYITLDGAKGINDQEDVQLCARVAQDFSLSSSVNVFIRSFDSNRGSALSVLEGCDWIFAHEQFALILEDDCIPSLDFFRFVEDCKPLLMSSDQIFSISGTQFAPSSITENNWALSKYPIFWGWATSKSQWQEARCRLLGLMSNKEINTHLSRAEFSFWKSGARRSLNGYIDAWDLPLLFVLLQSSKLTLQPGQNLIKNIGLDFAATHTTSENDWTEKACDDYIFSNRAPVLNLALDGWLAKNFYRISKRHIFTTRVTQILDKSGINRKVRSPLSDRWK